MALAGTLRDFSIADILQLIGLQRKTGVLTLKGPGDTVTLLLEEGSIVAVESEARKIEDRLGAVLLKTGKIRPEQLDHVLRQQRETGRRVGDLLVAALVITREDLARALELQTTQVLYRLFRWSTGEYHFRPQARVDYDREYFRPLPVDNILMEGMRILDEWPQIERRVRSFETVYESATEAGLRVAAEPELPPPARRVFDLLDGRRTVQDVIDQSDLGEFETCRVLAVLIESNRARPVMKARPAPPPVVTRAPRAGHGVAALLVIATVLAACGSVVLAVRAPLAAALWPFPQAQMAGELALSVTHGRLAQLDEAVRIELLRRGRPPASLGDLVAEGRIPHAALRDPWGRNYEYVRSRRNYQIRGFGPAGEDRADLIRTAPWSGPAADPR